MTRTIALREIAEAVGVSISTVSRALRDDPRIGRNTRRRIQAALDLLSAEGDAARPMARSAPQGQSLALILPAHGGQMGDTEVSMAVLESLQTICQDHARTLVTGRLYPDRVGFEAMGLFSGALVFGVIGYRMNDADAQVLVRAADQARVPCVLLNRLGALELAATGGFVCGVDHHQAGRLAAEHLLALGHRHLGTVFGLASVQSSRLRLEGIAAACAQAGVRLDPPLQATGVETPAAARAQAVTLVQRGATALIFDSDRQALHAQEHLLALGFRVPEEVSLLGFDGTEAAALAVPSLASVYTPWREMARSAAQLLLMRQGDPLLSGSQMLWRPRLMPGESCAAPSA